MATEQITVLRCSCEKCGKSWNSRDKHPPERCPYCGSRKWNTQPQRPSANPESKIRPQEEIPDGSLKPKPRINPHEKFKSYLDATRPTGATGKITTTVLKPDLTYEKEEF